MNPPILAIETAVGAGSLCLLHNGDLREIRFEHTQQQAAELVISIESLLREAGIWYEDLGGIATTIGPGSFTGIRIGLAAARAIAFSRPHLARYAITTAECLAAGYEGKADTIYTLLRAGKGELYYQAFERAGEKLVPVDEIELLKPAELEILEPQAWIGNAAELLSEGYRALLQPPLEPQARFLIRAIECFDIPPSRGLKPLYIRTPDAKLPTKPAV